MKHLVIRNFGPLKEVDVELKRINVIIGSQSSGKSCVLKTACYCTWVEKRIELTQTSDFFAKDGNFLKELERFHKLKGYIKEDTFIGYESDFMAFSYDNATKTFKFDWKEDRWNYRRSKVTYIPAERNLVAAIPNWFQVKFADDNIRDFMADWETARQATQEDLSVLNLGVSYHYDANTKSDKVQVADGVTLDFTNTSSGLQSVIPLFVHLNYITKIKSGKTASFATLQELKMLTSKLDEEGKMDSYNNYASTYHCDIFLEEPEANLFPPTQSNLVEWLLSLTKGKQPNNLFVATHSPYILNAFLEKQDDDINLFFTNYQDGQVLVRTATEENMQEIYDYGVDAFFNIESLG
ncbi:AAA family ATPase [Prevotella sp. E2-28]|uniref:AAA family ATPase n=1 Tax=Prevotella sp. E2-28 TaxID=2913620 RepID=UPI001EDA0D73|nr:AAA family ATPase [Prevotella sp. E2-28]UKK54934.1 ATP-binding protein [Prevotella sp. E2-28]